MKKILLILSVFIVVSSCKDQPKNNNGDKPIEQPVKKPTYKLLFDADSAYEFIHKQVSFGPRVPGSMPHSITASYLKDRLADFCDTSFYQEAMVQNYKGENIAIKNIIGSFDVEKKDRILLCAHWDTRPQADEDQKRPNDPADGANDGASGVGVLLEIARQLSAQRPELGVDIIFFDAEDMGERFGGTESWCLGSQHWAENPHKKGYNARYGILLDMVGAADAVFTYEGNSMYFADYVVKKVWRNGIGLGYGKYFIPYPGGSVTDDHFFINKIAGIPTIDIIHYDTNLPRGFGEYWHTHDDNMDIIDKNTLNAVGRTVLKTVWEEEL